MPKLENQRHENFCQEYVTKANYNATQAAKLARYSEKTAHVQGCRLLKDANIRARVKELQEIQGIVPEHVTSEVALLAFQDPREVLNCIDIEKMSIDIPGDVNTRIIQSIKIQRGKADSIEVRFHDKQRSLELLTKVMNMVTKNLNHTGKLTIADLVNSVDDAESEGD